MRNYRFNEDQRRRLSKLKLYEEQVRQLERTALLPAAAALAKEAKLSDVRDKLTFVLKAIEDARRATTSLLEAANPGRSTPEWREAFHRIEIADFGSTVNDRENERRGDGANFSTQLENQSEQKRAAPEESTEDAYRNTPAAEIDPKTLKAPVLSKDGWVCPPEVDDDQRTPRDNGERVELPPGESVERAHRALVPLAGIARRALEAFNREAAEISQRRPGTWFPIQLIDEALQAGFLELSRATEATRAADHPSYNLKPSTSETSEFFQVVAICYEAIGQEKKSLEAPIRAYMDWCRQQGVSTSQAQ